MRKNKLNLKEIKQVDVSGMLDLLLDFPGQCRDALSIGEDARLLFNKKSFNKIIFAGLGGSAIGADVVSSYLYLKSRIPVNVYREYRLPACLDSSSLVFLLSYSGNTMEILNAYRQAKEKGSHIVVISSGGKLKECARKDNVSFVGIPAGLPPRCAIGYLSIVPLCILAKLGVIKDVSSCVTETIQVLEGLKERSLNPSLGLKDNIAKRIGRKLYNKFAVVYSGSLQFEPCATRFRAQLSENSKALASSHVFPELNHSEIEGWKNPKKLFKDFAVVIFRDKDMYPGVVKGMDVAEGILKKENVRVIEIWSKGNCLLSRIFSLIYTGDFISYYLAVLYGIDPAKVDRIAYLKKQLARN